MKNIFFPFNQDNKELSDRLEKKWWHRFFVVIYSTIILVVPFIVWISLWRDLSFSSFTGLNSFIVFVVLLLEVLLWDYILFLIIQLIYYDVFVYIIYGKIVFLKKDLLKLFQFILLPVITCVIVGLIYLYVYNYEEKQCKDRGANFRWDYTRGCEDHSFIMPKLPKRNLPKF